MPETAYVGVALYGRRPRATESATFDHVGLRKSAPAKLFVPQVILRDGTIIAHPLVSVDGTAVIFSQELQTLTVLTRNVAAILFQKLPLGVVLPSDRTGLLMEDGDFLDGEFQGLAKGKVEMASVLFGRRSFDVRTGVLAVVLRKPTPKPATFQIRTANGSVFQASALRVETGSLALEVPLAGTLKVPLPEVLEISRQTAASVGH